MSYPSDFEYTRRVVVDDTDPRIKYDQGEWAIDNHSFDDITILGLPYNGTMHGTASTTASFSFEFEGEFVQVVGAKDNRKVSRPGGAINDTEGTLAKFACEVDGSRIRSIGYLINIFHRTNNILCEQGKLSTGGRHTLTVNVTVNDPTTQMFWLDRVEYAPLPNADLSKEVLKFDASDPAVQVDNSTGFWETVPGGYNGTARTGATASFKFNGTSVSLYGFNEGSEKYWEPATGRYYIDNKGDTTFTLSGSHTLPGLPNNTTDSYYQLLFASPNLEPGSHEMVITYTGVYEGKSIQPLFLDYFYVTASEGSKLNAAPPAGGGGGGGGEGGGGSGGGTGSGNGSPSGSGSGPQSGSKDQSNVGAIAGAVVGGVIGLALIAFAVWFFKKKQKRKDSDGQVYDGLQHQNLYNPPAVQPPVFTFVGQPPASTYTGAYAGPTMGDSSGMISSASTGQYDSPVTGLAAGAYDPYRNQANSPRGSAYGSHDSNRTESSRSPMIVSNPTTPTGVSQSLAEMKRAQSNAVSTPVNARQHQDSGIRYPQRNMVDIPPTYTAS